MASGQTLATWTAEMGGSFPSSNFATLDFRNNHPVYDFDDTTQESLYAHMVLARAYAGGGITVYVHFAATSATSGTGGWDISFERIGTTQDIDSDSFATAQTISAATVSGTSGIPIVSNVAITDGANIDSIAVGETFRVRVRRDVSNDTATGDLELLAIELKET